MVRRRSISLPSLFPRPWSRRRDLTGRPLSSPMWPLLDRSASPYLSRLGWPLRFRWGIKGKPFHCVAIAKSRLLSSSTVPPLLFFSLASFGQPATRPFLPLLHPLAEQAVRRLRRQPPEEARKKTETRTLACIADHASVRGDARVPPLDACSDVPLHHWRSLSSFSFPCTHSSPTSSWTPLRQWGEHYVSFTPSELSLLISVSRYIFHPCNICLIRRCCSSLVVEFRDEILFKGGRLWRPRFSVGLINPKDPVNRVDFGQTTVNLGHHLENITNHP
jgi:hypothetical protein